MAKKGGKGDEGGTGFTTFSTFFGPVRGDVAGRTATLSAPDEFRSGWRKKGGEGGEGGVGRGYRPHNFAAIFLPWGGRNSHQ